MKKWIGFFISLAFLVLIAYYILGFIVRDTLNKIIVSFPQNSIISVQLKDYQRGWFVSQALWVFKIHLPEQTITDKTGAVKIDPAMDFGVTIPGIIKHGPMIITNNGIRFGVGEITTQPETNYGVFINYLNQLIIKYTLPSVEINGKETSDTGAFQLKWMGLNELVQISSNIDNLNSLLEIYGFSGFANDNFFRIGKITHTFKAKRVQEWLWLGESNVDVSFIKINSANQDIFLLEKFKFNFASDSTNGSLNLNCDLSLDKLFADQQNYGPAIMRLSLKNLDPESMAKLNKEGYNGLTSDDTRSNLFIPDFTNLLAKGSILELSEMTINLPGGHIIGNFKISLPKTEKNDLARTIQQAQGQGYFKASIAVVKKFLILSIKSDLSSQTQSTSQPSGKNLIQSIANPSILANQAEEAETQADKMLQNLVNKGILKIENTDYVLQFKLENQHVIVNGKLVTSDMLH